MQNMNQLLKQQKLLKLITGLPDYRPYLVEEDFS